MDFPLLRIPITPVERPAARGSNFFGGLPDRGQARFLAGLFPFGFKRRGIPISRLRNFFFEDASRPWEEVFRLEQLFQAQIQLAGIESLNSPFEERRPPWN